MVKVISDSTCDLSEELLKKYDISILPLHIVLNDREYEDGRDIGPDEIYRWSDQNRTTPKTSAPSQAAAEELFRPFLEAGQEIVCFSISGQMSSSCNVMRLAAEALDAENSVFVVDSENLSTGIGLLVIEAALLARQGRRAGEIAAQIEKWKPLVRASFVVDTLVYLQRGGRCSDIAALMGGVLKLHPKIVVENGAMRSTKKYRGKLSRVVLDYVKDMEPELKEARTDRIFITHSGCSQEIIDAVYAYLQSLNRFKEILVTRAGGVISSHCGPGTLGVLFIA